MARKRKVRGAQAAIEEDRSLPTVLGSDDEPYFVYRTEDAVFFWHVPKALAAAGERGISMVEAVSAFYDRNNFSKPDPKYDENGHVTGWSSRHRYLLVVHVKVVKPERVTIVSARRATREEEEEYEEALGKVKPARDRAHRTRSRSRRSFLGFMDRLRARQTTFDVPPRGTRSKHSGAFGQLQEKLWSGARSSREKTPGKRVRAFRLLRKMSQSDLGRRSKVSQAALSRIESGKEPLGVHRAEALAHVLRVSPSDLLFGR